MNKSINKSEFIGRLSECYDYANESDVEYAVNELLTMIKTALANDKRVEVRGFGSFTLNRRDARLARNPKTGEQVQVGAKAIPHFKPGKALRENVNDSALID